jgi:hyperosmotically inducible periplasmic protein
VRRRKSKPVARSRPMKRSTLLVAAFLAAGLSVATLGIRAAVDTPRTLMSPDIHQQLRRDVEASTRLALAKCRDATGVERDVCKAEARAAERMALADLAVRYHGTHAAQEEAASIRARASFDVAKARCGAKISDARVQCLKEAREERNRMLAESRPAAS